MHRALIRQHRLHKVPIHIHLLRQHLLLALDRAGSRGAVDSFRGGGRRRRLRGAVGCGVIDGVGGECLEYAIGVWGGLHEDELGDPEGEGVADELL